MSRTGRSCRQELVKLGIRVSATTIRSLLRRHGLGPVPRREGLTWSEFIQARAHTILACDFFTVESLLPRTPYVLFAIEVAGRRIHILGVTRNPNAIWVIQHDGAAVAVPVGPPPTVPLGAGGCRVTAPNESGE